MASHGKAASTISPPPTSNPGAASYAQAASSDRPSAPGASQDAAAATSQQKKRKHRGGKKRRNRRQSFIAPPDELGLGTDIAPHDGARSSGLPSDDAARATFYRLRDNRSNNSLDSEALLDHRDHGFIQQRRQSIQGSGISSFSQGSPHRPSQRPQSQTRSKLSRQQRLTEEESEDDSVDDKSPLIGSSQRNGAGYGGLSAPSSSGRTKDKSTRRSSRSSTSSRRRRPVFGSQISHQSLDYDVNNPPSVPSSPKLGLDHGFDDVMLTTGEVGRSRSPEASRDALINIYEEPTVFVNSTPPSPKAAQGDLLRRMTLHASEDVCFPQEGMSEMGQEDFMHLPESGDPRSRRRRARRWPELSVLEQWSHEEKEQRTMEGIRARQVNEPLMVGGRLRPQKQVWHREVEDAPYRFTYFNEEFPSTIHSQTISELVQEGQSFRNLFIPDPPLLSDDSSEEDSDDETTIPGRDSVRGRNQLSSNGISRAGTRTSSKLSERKKDSSGEQTGANSPAPSNNPTPQRPLRYGPRPAFWLDVLSPTEAEMKVISKAFGIHPLTTEDILMQEAREKVELFRNYYFVNYRTFEQDSNSEDYLDPVNMYVVVFREGIITFHFSMTPHPANVRRRIRQLSDYLILSPDWISYAIIDDITDVYAPLIQRIEEEVDDIDDAILCLHSADEVEQAKAEKAKRGSLFFSGDSRGDYEKLEDIDEFKSADSGADMLRRVGECRKKVMSLYRLLGNKADVIKGFAKRCTEQWDVAPRSEIGLYLGDIQDHIVTMTGNLSHYENLLSRAHSNYLAQINIRMNERQEKTSDILGKLTVLGTIVLPMNIVTGMWGMNVLVPGQDIDSLWWFFGITAGLLVFGFGCYFMAKRVYRIV
ncbi:cora-domain-containing protein [Mytilinidion resinicola]|uniref:Cora-domain-containing protein n=1 Tax=Mytilinidion resinicola TaxID=574789 RepID=A0A6A6YGZ4_9PEZI|nr:cora-domain-containing protein [Mytilinidion resinicola]KAF2807848.1 cora-domain-containing protein [Mytilinidion resinicola]